MPHAISNQMLWVMAPLASPRKGEQAEPRSPPSKSTMCHTPSDSDSGLAWDSENTEKVQAQKSPRLMGTGGLGEYPRGDPLSRLIFLNYYWLKNLSCPEPSILLLFPPIVCERKATALILVLDAAQPGQHQANPLAACPVISLPLSLSLCSCCSPAWLASLLL